MAKLSRIMVQGKPFLSIGGQSHNSSSYELNKMEPTWNSIRAIHGNTLATPIPWDAWEPVEGEFNKKFVTDLIDEARRQDIKLSLLWFGTWKNGTMQYCPAWVKRDKERFQRCLHKDGTEILQLSAFCPASYEADKKAFIELIKLLKEYDAKEQTVIAVQIENEAGIQGGTRRDFSVYGEAAYQAAVPAKITDYCKANPDCILAGVWKKNGCKEGANWCDTFGYYGAEGVTAYGIAVYIDGICAEAKKVYPELFMYTNVWLDGGRRGMGYDLAGIDWPSGCANIHNLDIYYAVVKHLDTIAPDNYQQTDIRHKEVTDAYAHTETGFPLYVPESGAGVNVGQMFYAFSEKGAIGYHIFGSESYLADDGVTVRDQVASINHNFVMLDNVKSILFDYQDRGMVHAAVQEEGEPGLVIHDFDGIDCPVIFGQNPGEWPSSDFRHSLKKDDEVGRAMIFRESEKVFYAVGHNARIHLIQLPMDGSIPNIYANYTMTHVNFETVSVTEGHFDENGKYVVDITRSGDESRHGTWLQWDCGVVRIELV